MNVIKPVLIEDAQFASSTIPEDDYGVWSSGTTYALADNVIYAHRIYESLQASNLAHTPGAVGSETWWLDAGPTNQWAMFDQEISTPTISTSNSMTIVLQPGLINSVAMLELAGTYAHVTMAFGADTVYDQTLYFDSTPIEDWYEYFFKDYNTAAEIVFEDLPSYREGVLTIVIVNEGAVAQCGSLIVGSAYELGLVQYGARAGIIDYSRKETNVFGATTIVKRKYSKRMSLELQLDNFDIRRVQALLAQLRSTPCLWIGVPEDTITYGPLVVFGFYRDFQITVAYPTSSMCSLEIEGMI